MSNLKAVITQNKYNNFEVEIHFKDRLTEIVYRDGGWDIAYTLSGARRKARKMLVKAEALYTRKAFREEITL